MEPGTRSPRRGGDRPGRACFACRSPLRSGTPTISPPPQLEQLDFRGREHADRYAHDADPAGHVQLAVASPEVPHHVLGDQAPGRPTDQRQVELATVDMS